MADRPVCLEVHVHALVDDELTSDVIESRIRRDLLDATPDGWPGLLVTDVTLAGLSERRTEVPSE